jgi:hypothetical protein
MRFSNARLPNEHSALWFCGSRGRITKKIGHQRVDKNLIRSVDSGVGVTPDARERTNPIEVDAAKRFEGVIHG